MKKLFLAGALVFGLSSCALSEGIDPRAPSADRWVAWGVSLRGQTFQSAPYEHQEDARKEVFEKCRQETRASCTFYVEKSDTRVYVVHCRDGMNSEDSFFGATPKDATDKNAGRSKAWDNAAKKFWPDQCEVAFSN